MNALIVDDSMAMRKIQQRVLEGLGYVVATCGSGAEALQTLQKDHQFQLLVTDWHMPEMDGVALVKNVRADQRYAAMKIIMITSDAAQDSEQAAKDAGADDFVMKPFTAEVLAARLQTVMAKK